MLRQNVVIDDYTGEPIYIHIYYKEFLIRSN